MTELAQSQRNQRQASSRWCRALRAMTQQERDALSVYHRNASAISRQYTGRPLLRHWRAEINRLARAATGSPAYDRYVQDQEHRWAALIEEQRRHDQQMAQLVRAYQRAARERVQVHHDRTERDEGLG